LDEADFIVTEIQSDNVTKKNSYSDFAILYRTNAQSRVLEEAMLSAQIPYVLVGGVRFYERKEIKDVLAYLRLVLNPEDEISRKRAEKNGKSRLARLQDSRLKIQDSTLDLLDLVLKITQYLDQYDPMNEEDAARLENIKELRSVAAQRPMLADFLEQVALTEKEARSRFKVQSSMSNRAVTLMTMHAAKGLEFKTVFMVGMEEGLFPHSRTLMNPDELEEERRLAYVGMTRAMDKLYMTYARRRLYFGTRSNNMVSRFLGDIPQELVEPTSQLPSFAKSFGRATAGSNWGFSDDGSWKWKPD
jgi:DNA helicase-2/ATP-dependent DNA helicase PcrA